MTTDKTSRTRKPLTAKQKIAALAACARYKERHPERLKETQRRSYQAHKEHRAAQSKAYRESHPELFTERRKKIYWRDREQILANRKRWGQENAERQRDYRRRHDAENREQVREMKRRWNNANRDRINAQQRAYRAKNRDRVLQQFREWMQGHQEHFAELKRGKAPRRAAILQKWQLCGELCYICGEHLDRVDIEMDHVLPRVHEGTNDIENLMPTHKRCNRRKNKRLDYPIARFDLVQIATVIKSAPRVARRTRELEEAA